MRNKINYFPGKIIWILLFFMTILMGFPFFYYYKFSTIDSDLVKSNRLRVGQFGIDLSRYMEELLPYNSKTITEELEKIPVIADVTVEYYDREGNCISKRSKYSLNEKTEASGFYKAARIILDPMRGFSDKQTKTSPTKIRKRLVEIALSGQRGADYLFSTGEIADRVLYLSYPLRNYTGNGVEVKGALLLEYEDPSVNTLLKTQRNQFAVMCLIFGVMLTIYVIYVLIALVFPLRKLLRKLIAVKNRTDYLLSDSDRIEKNNEIGEISKQLDSVSILLNNREKEVEQYMTELKHIVRNPLTNIKVALEGLLMGRQTERDQSFSHIIQNNLAKIDMYISSYNPVSEIVGSELQIENININLFLEEVLQNYEPLAEKRQVRLKLKKPESSIIWKGFYAHLFYVSEQVINNAIDFSPENGIIKIDACAEEKKIIISISDQGPGIPLGKENEIFRQYVSYRAKTDRNHTGTGLYLSMKVMQKIGGSIFVKNNETGGAVFKIILPILSLPRNHRH